MKPWDHLRHDLDNKGQNYTNDSRRVNGMDTTCALLSRVLPLGQDIKTVNSPVLDTHHSISGALKLDNLVYSHF
jgi:hypothetical protein